MAEQVKPLSEKMISILKFMQANEGSHLCADIASAIGLESKSVNPVLTALVKRGLVIVDGSAQRERVNKKGETVISNYNAYALTENGAPDVLAD
jgi:predicted transcriptional regulator